MRTATTRLARGDRPHRPELKDELVFPIFRVRHAPSATSIALHDGIIPFAGPPYFGRLVGIRTGLPKSNDTRCQLPSGPRVITTRTTAATTTTTTTTLACYTGTRSHHARQLVIAYVFVISRGKISFIAYGTFDCRRSVNVNRRRYRRRIDKNCPRKTCPKCPRLPCVRHKRFPSHRCAQFRPLPDVCRKNFLLLANNGRGRLLATRNRFWVAHVHHLPAVQENYEDERRSEKVERNYRTLQETIRKGHHCRRQGKGNRSSSPNESRFVQLDIAYHKYFRMCSIIMMSKSSSDKLLLYLGVFFFSSRYVPFLRLKSMSNVILNQQNTFSISKIPDIIFNWELETWFTNLLCTLLYIDITLF